MAQIRLFLLLLLGAQVRAAFVAGLSPHARDLFEQSMAWMDALYDPGAGYMFDFAQRVQTGLQHDTRSSAWYAVGLLARNNGSDAEEAEKVLRNVIGGQFKDPRDQWYGTYQKSPEEPTVGSAAYPPQIYTSWDPNWRGFVGTAFIQCLEDFPHLLSPEVTALMLESLRNATVGDSYRVGGVDGDNLYPAYSNPSLMRAFVSGWTGRRLGVANFTQAGEANARELVELFDRAETLAEFNSGTYAGVSLHALALWARYMPSDSVMGKHGARMLSRTWTSLAELYHAGLKNSAGPWDRTYGYDMNRYLSILGLHIWALVGREASPIAEKPYAMSHSSDYAFAPLVAVMAAFHNSSVVPEGVIQRLVSFPGEHTVRTSAFSPPYDNYPRNISAWLSNGITIGAETFNESQVGGPSLSSSSFSPAVVQWDAGAVNGVGWLKWYATEPSLIAEASPGVLNLTYPYGNHSSIFTIFVSTFVDKVDVASWDDVQGVAVNVSGNANLTYEVSFNGEFGGAGETINEFAFWNFTYVMPTEFEGKPNLVFEVEAI